mgnify:CR=1 FL=1
MFIPRVYSVRLPITSNVVRIQYPRPKTIVMISDNVAGVYVKNIDVIEVDDNTLSIKYTLFNAGRTRFFVLVYVILYDNDGNVISRVPDLILHLRSNSLTKRTVWFSDIALIDVKYIAVVIYASI